MAYSYADGLVVITLNLLPNIPTLYLHYIITYQPKTNPGPPSGKLREAAFPAADPKAKAGGVLRCPGGLNSPLSPIAKGSF